MVVKRKEVAQGRFFQDIGFGEVFYEESTPSFVLMRTDRHDWVAVDIETGALYYAEDFDRDKPLYHIVKAEVTIDE